VKGGTNSSNRKIAIDISPFASRIASSNLLVLINLSISWKLSRNRAMTMKLRSVLKKMTIKKVLSSWLLKNLFRSRLVASCLQGYIRTNVIKPEGYFRSITNNRSKVYLVLTNSRKQIEKFYTKLIGRKSLLIS